MFINKFKAQQRFVNGYFFPNHLSFINLKTGSCGFELVLFKLLSSFEIQTQPKVCLFSKKKKVNLRGSIKH